MRQGDRFPVFSIFYFSIKRWQFRRWGVYNGIFHITCCIFYLLKQFCLSKILVQRETLVCCCEFPVLRGDLNDVSARTVAQQTWVVVLLVEVLTGGVPLILAGSGEGMWLCCVWLAVVRPLQMACKLFLSSASVVEGHRLHVWTIFCNSSAHLEMSAHVLRCDTAHDDGQTRSVSQTKTLRQEQILRIGQTEEG